MDWQNVLNGYQSKRRRRAIMPYVNKQGWKKFKGLDDFKKSYKGGWVSGSVKIEQNPLDFSLRVKANATIMVVVFNSQQADSDNLKLFTWEKVATRFESTVLHLADPTLYASETAKLGWYTANRFVNFQPLIGDFIEVVANKLHISQIIYVGSSGGGFPAAYYSQNTPNSSALLLAPTLSVRDSFQEESNYNFLNSLNGVESFDELQLSCPELCLSIPDLVQGRGGQLSNPIYLLQSKNDWNFWNYHTRQFLDSLGLQFETPPDNLSSYNLECVFGDWSEGHGPPPLSSIERAVDILKASTKPAFQPFSFSKRIEEGPS